MTEFVLGVFFTLAWTLIAWWALSGKCKDPP